MQVNTKILGDKPLALGFSGGRDSVALALWLKEHNIPFRAVHVNHQLQSYSDAWERWCVEWCNEHNIPIDVHHVVLSSGNVENSARNARREVWKLYPTVILCHHQNDQHETFFLRVLRGSGVRGLSSIQECIQIGDTRVVRPMLKTTRKEITHYVSNSGSGWIEDPTNADKTNDRNYIRGELIPKLYERFDRSIGAINTCIAQMQDAADLLDDLAKMDATFVSLGEPQVSIDAIRRLGEKRTKNMLHYWLSGNGKQVNGKQLNVFVSSLFATNYDGKTKAVFGGITIQQRGKYLFFTQK